MNYNPEYNSEYQPYALCSITIIHKYVCYGGSRQLAATKPRTFAALRSFPNPENAEYCSHII